MDGEVDCQRRAGPAESGQRLRRPAFRRRGRRRASAPGFARQRVWSARGQAQRRPLRKTGRRASAYTGMPWRSSRLICSATALHTERSPECSRATSWPARWAATYSCSISSSDIGAVSTLRASARAILQQFGRHDRAGIEADRAAGEQVAAAHGDEVGSARSGADEMHGHGMSPSTAMAHVTEPSRCAGRAGGWPARPRPELMPRRPTARRSWRAKARSG